MDWSHLIVWRHHRSQFAPNQYLHNRIDKRYSVRKTLVYGLSLVMFVDDHQIVAELGQSYALNSILSLGLSILLISICQWQQIFDLHAAPPSRNAFCKALFAVSHVQTLSVIRDSWLLMKKLVWHYPCHSNKTTYRPPPPDDMHMTGSSRRSSCIGKVASPDIYHSSSEFILNTPLRSPRDTRKSARSMRTRSKDDGEEKMCLWTWSDLRMTLVLDFICVKVMIQWNLSPWASRLQRYILTF